MCSIIGSFDLIKFKELIKINQYRGSFAYSYSSFDPKIGILNTIKDFGEFDINIINKITQSYTIGHIQAPTGGLIKDVKRIHPSRIKNSYLFHNGILKKTYIEKLQNKFRTNNNWDTYLLHKELIASGFEKLNNIDGSFGCVYIVNNNIYLFANDLINLFIDDEVNISSVKFNKSTKLPSNCVFKLDLLNKTYTDIYQFKTYNNPYYISEE